MPTEAPSVKTIGPSKSTEGAEIPYGVNEIRLNGRLWLVTLVIFASILGLIPAFWEKVEKFTTGPDYRIPYELSKDYWLYSRRMRQAAVPSAVLLLGDSVVWGEYVLPDGTLSHFLNREAGASDRFINAGLNGLFPLAQEGLIEHYARALTRHKVILQCNVLWMTSPKADLSTDKEEQFNHSRLVPQFYPRIPCYRADANERLSAVVADHIDFIAWVGHLQNAYFGQKSIPSWTLEEDSSDPPRFPNVYKNPLSQISLRVPSATADDPQRGPRSARHRPWTAAGQGATRFDWVPLNASLQWRAFQRVVETLDRRGNDVLVLLGPFNEHMVEADNRRAFHELREGIASWLKNRHVAVVAPETLPSELYADASHPLTDGYQLLAHRLFVNDGFQSWLRK